MTARSIEFDAVVVADGAPKDNDIKSVVLLQEAYRQLKPFAAWGDGAQVLAAAGIDPAGRACSPARARKRWPLTSSRRSGSTRCGPGRTS